MSQPTTREVRLAMNVARETCKLSGLDGILHILDAAISKLESLAEAEERGAPARAVMEDGLVRWIRPEQPQAMPPLPPGWEVSMPIDGPITAVSDTGVDYAWVGGAWELIREPLQLVTRSEFDALARRVDACEGGA